MSRQEPAGRSNRRCCVAWGIAFLIVETRSRHEIYILHPAIYTYTRVLCTIDMPPKVYTRLRMYIRYHNERTTKYIFHSRGFYYDNNSIWSLRIPNALRGRGANNNVGTIRTLIVISYNNNNNIAIRILSNLKYIIALRMRRNENVFSVWQINLCSTSDDRKAKLDDNYGQTKKKKKNHSIYLI